MAGDGPPTLVLAAHGTTCPEGPNVFDQLAGRIRRWLPGTRVTVAFVDVIGPTLHDVLAAECSGHGSAVVVPVFLGSGYHVEIDIPRIVEINGAQVSVARSLGPAPQIIAAVADRLRAASVIADRFGPAQVSDAVVLAAAGSTNAVSRQQTRTAADHLAAILDRPVTAGFLAAGTPRVADVVGRLRRDGATVAIATYLLAPGTFHDRLGSVGADVVADPVGPHPMLAELVVSRYREQVRLDRHFMARTPLSEGIE